MSINLSSRSVVQIEKGTNTILQTYDSSAEAERTTGIDRRNILRCCKKNGASAGGYKWVYSEPRKECTVDLMSPDDMIKFKKLNKVDIDSVRNMLFRTGIALEQNKMSMDKAMLIGRLMGSVVQTYSIENGIVDLSIRKSRS